VRNALQILHLQETLSGDSRWALQVIDRQMQQMTRLIDDLMDVSRITRNRLELRKERIELSEVVRAAIETGRPQLEAGGQELTVSYPPGPILVEADPTRLAQAFANLLDNAARYTERGGRVWMSAERQGSDAVVTVRDTGIGIPRDMLSRIFEMFTQVDRSLERSRGGLGIGLTLVKRLVEMHGGTVGAHSEGPGQGSEFTVRLPVAGEVRHTPGAERLDRDPAALSTALRILIVDDNRDSAESLGLLLRLTGNDIRTAHDGVEACEAASRFCPDVAVLDIGLPRMNGYEVARRIRRESWGKSMVLIAVTGWGQESDKHSAHEAGFDRHMVKPVDPAAFLRLLASIDQERRG
jgi:CheY-like chemotaxis protein